MTINKLINLLLLVIIILLQLINKTIAGCTGCIAGQYCNINTCASCPAGTWSNAGDTIGPSTTACYAPTSVFVYTGATQTYTVPFSITKLLVEAYGGSGSTGQTSGGGGGFLNTTLAVLPGQVLQVTVGGSGDSGNGNYCSGGVKAACPAGKYSSAGASHSTDCYAPTSVFVYTCLLYTSDAADE